MAERMYRQPKVVFSRTLDRAAWNNTVLIKGNLVGEVRGLKGDPGPDMVILGSGSLVS
jgi:dihydrofolate reductase